MLVQLAVLIESRSHASRGAQLGKNSGLNSRPENEAPLHKGWCGGGNDGQDYADGVYNADGNGDDNEDAGNDNAGDDGDGDEDDYG